MTSCSQSSTSPTRATSSGYLRFLSVVMRNVIRMRQNDLLCACEFCTHMLAHPQAGGGCKGKAYCKVGLRYFFVGVPRGTFQIGTMFVGRIGNPAYYPSKFQPNAAYSGRIHRVHWASSNPAFAGLAPMYWITR